jgi:enamine deaminase RidA (YjgF/YER057c/UK114 family)
MKILRFFISGLALLLVISCNSYRTGEKMKSTESFLQHLNPDGLHKNLAHSQAIVVSGLTKTVYVGGQNAVDASGTIVGRGDIKVQVEQIFKNLQVALDGSGARLKHVVKWNVYVVQGQPIEPGFEVFQRVGKPT